MDFAHVLAQIGKLPPAFKRPGQLFAQVQDSQAAALTLYTAASDGVLASASAIANASAGWLDVWGLLFGLPRRDGESDTSYGPRIQNTIMATVATLPGMQAWATFMLGAGATVTENSPGPGYTITVPVTTPAATIQVFLISLLRIRPAGVPFGIRSVSIGLYLNTVNYMGGAPDVVGAYLTGSVGYGTGTNGGTDNSIPLLPDTLFTDPTLNPSLATTGS